MVVLNKASSADTLFWAIADWGSDETLVIVIGCVSIWMGGGVDDGVPVFMAKMADIDGVDVIETTFDCDNADVIIGNLDAFDATTVAVTLPCTDDGTMSFGGINIALDAFVFSKDD